MVSVTAGSGGGTGAVSPCLGAGPPCGLAASMGRPTGGSGCLGEQACLPDLPGTAARLP